MTQTHEYAYKLYGITQHGATIYACNSAGALLTIVAEKQRGRHALTWLYLILWRTADEVVLLTHTGS